MKRLPLIFMLTAVILATGCTSMPEKVRKIESAPTARETVPPLGAGGEGNPADRVAVHDKAGKVVVQKVKFRVGVSSASVEHLAKRFGCTGSPGAGLITKQGPVEIYRMQCDNGTTFMAECELRQCRPMR